MVARTPLEELSRNMSRDASEKMILRPCDQEHPKWLSEQENTQAVIINACCKNQNSPIHQSPSGPSQFLVDSGCSLERNTAVNPKAT